MSPRRHRVPAPLRTARPGALPDAARPRRPRPAHRVRALWWRARFVVAAACCGLAASCVVGATRPAPPPSTDVVVTARDVPGGTRLTAADLRAVTVAPDLVPHGSLADLDAAVGRTTSVRLAAGTALQDSLVAAGDLVAGAPEGTVVAPVRLDPSVADLLAPGDRVDLVLASGWSDAPVAADPSTSLPDDASDPYLAHGALVVPGRQAPQGGGLLDAGSGPDAAITLVAVQPEEAALLATAAGRGEVTAVLVP